MKPEAFRSTESKIDALRTPPQSVEAEQAVLGGIMLAPESILHVADWLKEDDFYRRDHRLIYRALVELHSSDLPLDPVTLGEWFDANDLTSQIGSTGYLIELASTTPSAANIQAYAEIVREKSQLRRAIEVGTALVNDAFKPGARSSEDLIASIQLALGELHSGARHTGPIIARVGFAAWYEHFNALYERGDPITGLMTPWHDVNMGTHGLQDGELVILAGRPSMGKSLVAGQLAAFTAVRGDATVVFTLETTTTSFMGRTMACLADVPHDFIKAPCDSEQPTDDENTYMARIAAASKLLVGAPLYVDETPGLTSAQICARAERLHRQKRLRLVVIDHLHIVSRPGRNNETYEIGEDTRRFKALAKRLGCPVVLLAQLNRKLEDRTNKRPVLSDLRASGDIEQDADVVIFVHRPDYHDKTDTTGIVELIPAKGRDLKVGDPWILKNHFDRMRLGEWGSEPIPTPPKPKKTSRDEAWGDVKKRSSGEKPFD